MFDKLWSFYEVEYKKLLIIPILLQLFFGGVIIHHKLTTGFYFGKDISLKGGTSITYYTSKPLSGVNSWLKDSWGGDTELVVISDALGGFRGYEFRVGSSLTIDEVAGKLSVLVGHEVSNSEFSMGLQGASIANSFFHDALIIIAISFLLMGLVVFYYFKSVIPAVSITFSTIADVVVVIGMLDLLGIPLSVAGIGALLMLIGLSTDSDILLATNIILKHDMRALRRSFKTELTMSLASFTVSSVMVFLTSIDVIRSIALILMIGSVSDMINTWILSAGLQRLYADWRRRK